MRTNNALASAAHDLKTPLAILNGYVELLQSEKLGDLNDRQREVIGDMRSNGQRLQHFIEDFLSFSVLETGQMKLRYEAADMNACLAEELRVGSQATIQPTYLGFFKSAQVTGSDNPRYRTTSRL